MLKTSLPGIRGLGSGDRIRNMADERNAFVFRCVRRKTEMDMHVPKTGHEILTTTIDQLGVMGNSETTIAAHRRDDSSLNLDSHGRQQSPGFYVHDLHVLDEKRPLLRRCPSG